MTAPVSIPVKPLDPQQLLQDLSRLPCDFRAEAVAAELVENGLAEELLRFKRLSLFKRFVGRDIAYFGWQTEDKRGMQDVCLEIGLNREGMYDMLPEGLTHARGDGSGRPVQNERYPEQKKQERDARTFFSVWEQEFARRQLWFELKERAMNRQAPDAQSRACFTAIFGRADMLSDEQIGMLLHILPLSARIRADVRLIGQVLSRVLAVYIQVTQSYRMQCIQTGQAFGSVLGQGTLGLDMVLNDRCRVARSCYDIHIRGLDAQAFRDFSPGGRLRPVLDFLEPYFFPATAVVQLLPEAPEALRGLSLAQEQEAGPVLGFNTYI